MKIVLLGPPGAGKGTQAKSISNRYSIPHISTGDIFRKNISEETPLGIQAKQYIDNGQLVPDEVTINMVKDRLTWEDCKNAPSVEGVCDVCGDNVIQRKDDVEETVKERLDVYERQTQPLIDFYKEKNLLSTVDGTKAINEVFESICNILGSAN